MDHQGSLDEELPAFDLTDKDRENLARKDEDFEPLSWGTLKAIIARNDLESLRRWPSDLKRYLKWTRDTKAVYGTITDYLCHERLHWQPLPKQDPHEGPSFHVQDPIPFRDARDYKILYNDWPYGMAPDITHIVVWMKTSFDVEPADGELLPKSRQSIEDFVQHTFIARLQREGNAEDRVMWFRNWTGLQSVRGIDHIHILVRHVPQEIMDEWTGGRTPLP
ncbi:MAG: hypothetical protein Q9182_004174 [Xanthomendoza sp. 2 TL-2023]